MHAEHDPVSPIIDDIDGENSFLQPSEFSEIEFSQAASSLNCLGELDVFDKVDSHMWAFLKEFYQQFQCYDSLKNSKCGEKFLHILKKLLAASC